MSEESTQNGRIQTLEGQLTEVVSAVSSLTGQVEILVKNQGRDSALIANSGPTWGVVLGIIATLMVGLGGMGLSNAGYVNLATEPQFTALRSEVADLEADMVVIHDFKDHVHYEVGALHTFMRFMESADGDLKNSDIRQWNLLRDNQMKSEVNRERYQWGMNKDG